jgi:hypothetical protein
MKIYYVIFCLLIVGFLLACGTGEIPSATEPLIELEAAYVTSRPLLDGCGDDNVWQNAEPYILHVEETGGDGGFNIILKAIWWKEWTKGTTEWSDKAFLALLVNWPDDDKNIDKMMWTYTPQDSHWTMSENMSDWLVIQWYSAGNFIDLWYWDAALTNPLGYAEDQYLEVVQLTDSTYDVGLLIDGLNSRNDTQDQQNTYDLNYDDNLTPDDPSDDHPKWAWRADPDSIAPSLPRIVSNQNERWNFLLWNEAEILKNTPYANPIKSVTVPGFVLEEPKDQPADIMAAGSWDEEAKTWTVELARTSATDQVYDIGFTVDDRWFRQSFYLTVGDNIRSPLEMELAAETETPLVALYSVVLTFEFVQ